MSLFIISDLHLSPSRPAITQAFYYFLDHIANNASSLYILGDFFEVWLGDDDDTPEYADIIRRLRTYSDSGISVYFMHGNRDFLVGECFAKRTQASLLEDPTVLNDNDCQYLLMHGDSLCTRDHDYMAFREMARSSQWQEQFLAQPLADRKAFAEKVRASSKTMNSRKAQDIMDVTPEDVVRIMEQYQVKTLIHGHTHRPAVHPTPLNNDEQAGERVVLGDWGNQAWYVLIDDKGYQLNSYNL